MQHKIIVSGAELQVALPILKKLISKNNVLPILEDVLLTYDNGKCTLTVTDLETSVIFTLRTAECASAEVWRICIPFVDLTAIKSKELLTLECDATTFVTGATDGFVTYRIQGENGEDFPRIPQLTDEREYLLMGDDVTPYQKALSFAGRDDMRPAMTGVYLEVQKNKRACIVSTDAHRLYQYDVSDANVAPHNHTIGVILYPKTVQAMSKLSLFAISVSKVMEKQLDEAKSTEKKKVDEMKPRYVNVFIDGKVTTKGGDFDVQITGRLIDARYPDFRAVVPTDNPVSLKIEDVTTFTKILDSAIATANKTTHQVMLHLNGTVKIEARDLDYSKEMAAELPKTTYVNKTPAPQMTPMSTDSPNRVKEIEQLNKEARENYVPKPFAIGFNGVFLKEIAKTLTPPLKVVMSTPARAAIWTGANKKESLLVMPVLINV